jgi:hypothetical protein
MSRRKLIGIMLCLLTLFVCVGTMDYHDQQISKESRQ